MFQKLKQFWQAFWQSMKSAYSEFKAPIEDTSVQKYSDITAVNFLAIFVTKLSNLGLTEATFNVKSDSKLTEPLEKLSTDLQNKRYSIVESMLSDGDCFIFPALDNEKHLYHSVLPQERVRITKLDGEHVIEAFGIIDTTTISNKTYFLLRKHALTNGNLEITYEVVTDQNVPASISKWEDINGLKVVFQNANHIGFGRYKSPTSSRGKSPIYGVPLNYGCGDIEHKIQDTLQQIVQEFDNGQSRIFTDPRNIKRPTRTYKNESGNTVVEEYGSYKLEDFIIPVKQQQGMQGNNIDIFSPALRFSEHYDKLISQFALYEKQVGTSRGILTDNETTTQATATEVKRANSDTIALLEKIHNSVDSGNKDTLLADCVYLNIPQDTWEYSSDYFDPFDNPDEQFNRLKEAANLGAIRKERITKWLFPSLSDEEVEKEIQQIAATRQAEQDIIIDSLLSQG